MSENEVMYPSVAETLIPETHTDIASKEAKAREEAQEAEEKGDGKAVFKAAMTALKAAEKRKEEEEKQKKYQDAKVATKKSSTPVVAAASPPPPAQDTSKNGIVPEKPVEEVISFKDLMAKAKKKENDELAHQAGSLEAYKKKKEEERIEAEKKAEEDKIAAAKKAEEEKIAAAKKAEEDKIAAEKKAEEDQRLLVEDAKEMDSQAYQMKVEEVTSPRKEAPAPEPAPAADVPASSSSCCVIC